MYSVIEFLHENSVEAVPSTWVISTHRSGDRLCFWPDFKGKQLTNAIIDLVKPDLAWKAHPCRVIKEGFVNILKARNIAARYSLTSDIESGDDRKRAAPAFFVDAYSSPNQEKENRLEDRPPKQGPSRRPVLTDLPPLPAASTSALLDVVDLDFQGADSLSCKSPQPLVGNKPSSAMIAIENDGNLMDSSIDDAGCQAQTDSQVQIAALVQMVRAQHKKMCLLSARQRELLQGFDNMEKKMTAIHNLLLQQRGGEHSLESVIDFEKIESEEGYTTFVAESAARDFQKAVISKLVVVGGDNPLHMAVRCINFLLANEMQKKFNRTGVRGKLNFSQVIEPMIKEAIQQRFTTNVNFSEIEKKIGSYLAIAGDRDGGRKRRGSADRPDTRAENSSF